MDPHNQGGIYADRPRFRSKTTRNVDRIQTAGDFAGMVPGVGNAVDVANTALYGLRGKWEDFGFGVGAALPIIGQGSTTAKYGQKCEKFIDEAIEVASESVRVHPNRKAALNAQKDALGIPRSQQPTRSWTVHDPSQIKGAGVRDTNVRNQGRIYEYEVTTSGGSTKKFYISDHHADSLHGGIGHVHTGVPKPGATSVEPGGRYMEIGELVPYRSR